MIIRSISQCNAFNCTMSSCVLDMCCGFDYSWPMAVICANFSPVRLLRLLRRSKNITTGGPILSVSNTLLRSPRPHQLSQLQVLTSNRPRYHRQIMHDPEVRRSISHGSCTRWTSARECGHSGSTTQTTAGSRCGINVVESSEG